MELARSIYGERNRADQLLIAKKEAEQFEKQKAMIRKKSNHRFLKKEKS